MFGDWDSSAAGASAGADLLGRFASAVGVLGASAASTLSNLHDAKSLVSELLQSEESALKWSQEQGHRTTQHGVRQVKAHNHPCIARSDIAGVCGTVVLMFNTNLSCKALSSSPCCRSCSSLSCSWTLRACSSLACWAAASSAPSEEPSSCDSA